MYDIVKRPKIEFGLGLTVKLRQASIGIKSSELSAIKKNLGVVPLIHFALKWHWTPAWGLQFEGDAFGITKGRAEDALLAVAYKPIKHLDLYAGYRILEGGSNAKTVYTFALFNSAVVGVKYTF